MNYLLSYGAAGMGDLLTTVMFLQDFEKQMPNDRLYFRFEFQMLENRYLCIFDNNPYFHKYDSSIKIDKCIHFGWGESINEVEQVKLNTNCPYVYTDVIYHEFNKRAGTNIVKTASKVDIYLSEEEKKPVISSDKPICVLNIGYSAFFSNSRNWGWEKFQYLVNKLHDKITFVQVGTTDTGYFHFPLMNCINLLDKTSIRSTFSLLNHASYVLTHNSGLLHMASFEGNVHKKIIGILGGRDFYNFMNCYDIPNVEYKYFYNNEMFSSCYENGKYCCDCGLVCRTAYVANGGNQIICKRPSLTQYGNIVCECFNYINPDDVIKEFN